MQASIEIVTPAMAKEYLERAMPNRPLSEPVIARYTADMADGLWLNNGQSVIFSDTNELMDGQQRMHAIIRSGRPQSCVVVRGVPRQAFVTMDTGKGRTLADVMAIEGHHYANNLSAAARIAFTYASGLTRTRTLSFGTLERFIRQHPYLPEITEKVCRETGGSKLTLPKTQLAALLFLANERRLHDKAVHDFIEGLATGAKLWSGDARLTVRNWLIGRNADPHRQRGDYGAALLFTAFAKAWTAFGSGSALHAPIRAQLIISQSNTPIYGFDQTLYHGIQKAEMKRREEALASSTSAANAAKATEASVRLAAKRRRRPEDLANAAIAAGTPDLEAPKQPVNKKPVPMAVAGRALAKAAQKA